MGSIVNEIITILTSGLTSMASGIGNGLKELTSSVFLDNTTDTTKLSTFGSVVCIFAGISLAIGLSTLIVKWVMSLGSRN